MLNHDPIAWLMEDVGTKAAIILFYNKMLNRILNYKRKHSRHFFHFSLHRGSSGKHYEQQWITSKNPRDNICQPLNV